MDVALLRVLHAHSLLACPRLALGRLGPVARLLGDPRLKAADLFLSMHNVLRATYPLQDNAIDTVLADENYLSRIFDQSAPGKIGQARSVVPDGARRLRRGRLWVIPPRVEPLYEFAALDLDEPQIRELCTEQSPVYAWPLENREVWRTARSRKGIAVASVVVGPPTGDGPAISRRSAGGRR